MSSLREINCPGTPYHLIQEDLGIFLIPKDEVLQTHGFPKRCKLLGYFVYKFILSKRHRNDGNRVLTELREARLGRKLGSNWKNCKVVWSETEHWWYLYIYIITNLIHLRDCSCEEGQWFAEKKEMNPSQQEKVGLGGAFLEHWAKLLRATEIIMKFYTYSSSPLSPSLVFRWVRILNIIAHWQPYI